MTALAPRTAPPPVDVTARRPRVARSLLRDPAAVVGLVLVGAVVGAALLAPLLAPHDPNATDVLRRLESPSRAFPLGTDQVGRDVLSRLLFGARVSVGATVLAAACITLLGTALGLLAGYLGGVVDALVSRIIEVLLAFPTFLLALAVTGVLGPGLTRILVAVVAVWWAGYARVVRSAVLAERGRPYVEAAQALGAGSCRILRRHILPNVVAPVVVLTTLDMGALLLGLSALSFLGLGVSPPAPEWGSMLSEGRAYLSRAPHLMVFPGAAIFLLVLGFNLLGDGLRDVLDPHTRRRR